MVFLLQFDIGSLAVQYVHDVDGDHRIGEIRVQTRDLGPSGKLIPLKPRSLPDQLFDGVAIRTQLILAGSPDGSRYDNPVVVVGDDGVDHQRVAVLQDKRRELFFVDGCDLVTVAGFPFYPDVLRVGVSCETACHAKQIGQRLASAKLVRPFTFHLAACVDKLLVRTDDDHVIVFEADVGVVLAVKQVVVHVEVGDLLAVPVHLYIAQ